MFKCLHWILLISVTFSSLTGTLKSVLTITCEVVFKCLIICPKVAFLIQNRLIRFIMTNTKLINVFLSLLMFTFFHQIYPLLKLSHMLYLSSRLIIG